VSDIRDLLGPELLAALEAFVDERIRTALAEHDPDDPEPVIDDDPEPIVPFDETAKQP
jgi:hypothetical protein